MNTKIKTACLLFVILLIPIGVFSQVNYNSTTLSGSYSSAIGQYTKAQNSYTFSAGKYSEANGAYAMALGYYSRAVSSHTFASGINTYASGSYATAMGDYTRAYASQSMAIGLRTIANSQACFALGKYNIGISGTLFELGNGTSTSNRKNAITVLNNGNVGIGESSPTLGQLQINPTTVDQHHGITIYAGGSTARSYVKSDGGTDYDWYMTRGGVDGKGILITKDGFVGIGTTSVPSDYHLAVDGGIIAEEVFVELSGDWWPDHVFQKDYNLMSLAELENYVTINNHLPDVPSEGDIRQEGINLGKMDALLLQKIEELTLYVILLKKENSEMRNKLDMILK
ncbi:hypothetical protein LCGC14_1617880 [marine sediment metagenome]|uniref:Trimeric autotransporter adhesin YadA-like head domain-containing protein n=1 Tax=marine sediment metagenome TaxID=412755 RepID=A0A0F9IT84_9ZZZZ